MHLLNAVNIECMHFPIHPLGLSVHCQFIRTKKKKRSLSFIPPVTKKHTFNLLFTLCAVSCFEVAVVLVLFLLAFVEGSISCVKYALCHYVRGSLCEISLLLER